MCGEDLEVSDMARLGLDSDATANQRYGVVAKAVKEIEEDIRALSSDEKLQLLRSLLAELDAPADPNVERAWLETAQRRYRELIEGKVQGVPGPLVFERLRARLSR
jgi:putative addiction module component